MICEKREKYFYKIFFNLFTIFKPVSGKYASNGLIMENPNGKTYGEILIVHL